MPNKRIPLKFYLLLFIISVVHTEIMAGTTDLTHFITQPVLAWSNILFYGLSLIIYVDLAHRFKFDLIEIFILGLIHGVVEEGVALWTFFFQRPEHSSTIWLGINLNWAILVTIGEAFLLPILGVLFARIVFPLKEGQAWLTKKGYVVAGTILILLIGLYNLIVAGFHKQVPKALPYFVTWLTVFLLALSLVFYHQKLKQQLHQLVAPKKNRSKKIYTLLTLLFFFSYVFSGFFLDQPRPVLTTFLIPVLFMTPILLLLNFTIWSDTNFNKSKQVAIFITLLLSFSISMSVQRSLQNTLLLALIVIWEIYLVFKAVKLHQQEMTVSPNQRALASKF